MIFIVKKEILIKDTTTIKAADFFKRRGVCPNCNVTQMEMRGIPSNHCYTCPEKPSDIEEAVEIALHFKPRKSYWGTICPECHKQVPNLLGRNKFMCIYCKNIIDVDDKYIIKEPQAIKNIIKDRGSVLEF